jgi:hypothetical protein
MLIVGGGLDGVLEGGPTGRRGAEIFGGCPTGAPLGFCGGNGIGFLGIFFAAAIPTEPPDATRDESSAAKFEFELSLVSDPGTLGSTVFLAAGGCVDKSEGPEELEGPYVGEVFKDPVVIVS